MNDRILGGHAPASNPRRAAVERLRADLGGAP